MKDFPESSYQEHGLEVIHPEELLIRLLNQDEDGCREALHRNASRRRNPPMTTPQLLAQLASHAPTFANTVHQQMLDGEIQVSDIPALVTEGIEASPLHKALTDPDPTDPLSVAANWWKAMLNKDTMLDVLDALTFSPAAWKDYQRASDLLADQAIASRVYYAVDAPDDLAFVRFVPDVAQSSRVFASYRVPDLTFLTPGAPTRRHMASMGPRLGHAVRQGRRTTCRPPPHPRRGTTRLTTSLERQWLTTTGA